MRMSEIIGTISKELGLWVWPVGALLVFVAVWAVLVSRVLRMPRAERRHAADLPTQD